MLESHLENSRPYLKMLASNLIRKRNYDSDQINRFYMRDIQVRKNDIPDVFNGTNREINKNIKGKDWDALSKFDRVNRKREVEIIDNLLLSKKNQ